MTKPMISVSLQGEERLLERLMSIDAGAREKVKKPLQAALDLVQATAVRGIAEGPKTGRIYTQFFATSYMGNVFAYGSRPPHQASAPNEYPASDTGNLMRSIYNEIEDALADLDFGDADAVISMGFEGLRAAEARISGIVGADAEYAAPLEYKPPEKGGRPFLRRALTENMEAIAAMFVDDLKGAFGGSGGGGGSPPPSDDGPPSPPPTPPRPPRPPPPPPPRGPSETDLLNIAELERIDRLLGNRPPPSGGEDQ